MSDPVADVATELDRLAEVPPEERIDGLDALEARLRNELDELASS